MVKCKDCGYVGARSFDTRLLLEADEAFRNHVERGYGLHGKVLYFGLPVCSVGACDLSREARDDSNESTKQILNRERTCEAFTQWHQGMNPREHIEMNLLERQREVHQQQLAADQAWRENQDRRDQAWREKQDQIAAKRHAEESEANHRRHQEVLEQNRLAMQANIRSYVVSGVIGFVGALAAVALAFLLQN